MADWSKIREEFKTTGLSMKALAEKHGVKPSTLRSRKNREDWTKENDATQRNEKKNVATQRNKKKSVATQKAIEQLNNNDELTDKQKQFCLLYLKYFNATKAYQEAYEVEYSTANANGSRMLANASIKEELERLKKIQRSELYIDSLDVKKEWLKQAFADITDFVDFGPMERSKVDEVTGETETWMDSEVILKPDSEVDGTLIQEVKKGRDGTTIKLYDKQKAMDRLMEFLESEEEASAEDTVIFMTDTAEMEKWVEENGGL